MGETYEAAGVSINAGEEAVRRIKAAGLDSIAGAGAEMLPDRPRQAIAPLKESGARWLEVMEVAHGLGHRTLTDEVELGVVADAQAQRLGLGLLAEVADQRQAAVGHVQRARLVAEARGEQPDVVDHGVQWLPPDLLDDELVADAVAIFEEDLEAGEVVVDLVLAADRHAGTDDPDDDRDDVIDHPRRGVDALTPADGSHLGSVDDAVAHRRPPPPGGQAPGPALGHSPDDAAQHQPGDAREQQGTDYEGDDGGCGFHDSSMRVGPLHHADHVSGGAGGDRTHDQGIMSSVL